MVPGLSIRGVLVSGLAVALATAGLMFSIISPASAISLSTPAAPTSLVAYRGNTSAEIAFSAGANGGASITNYKYQIDDGSWTAFSPAVTTPSVTIGGLTNGTTYSVKLRAVNSVGDGEISSAVSVTPADVNALNWTGRTAPEANQWESVTYANGLFVAVGWSNSVANRVMTSPDGVTWTARSAPSSQWQSVTYGNGLFVAVANYNTDRVMTSPDGITWTARTAAAAAQWTSVTYANGLFVAVASSSNYVMTSPDGVTWTARTGTASNYWNSVTFGNGLFVAVANSGGVMTSPDGITWTARSAAEANNWFEVTYGNGLFVAVANNGTNRVMTSPNGITWTSRSAPGAEDWHSLTYGNGNFVSAAYSKVMYSTDGITWVSRPSARNNWRGIAYGNGKFVAVAAGNTPSAMTSELTEPTTPDAPTSLAVTIGKGSASVAFTAGADGGSSITNYEYQLNGTGAWTALSPVDTSSPVTISGLTNGTPYTVKLRAVNALGAGAASAASASFTPLLRLVTPAQEGTLSILAGTGSLGTPTPGPATSSALGGLDGLAVDSSGNTFIADASNNKVFKITSGGALSVFAGTGTGGSFGSAPPAITPGPATSADLSGPSGLAVDSSGNLYVAVTDSRQIVKITPSGTLSIVAGTGQWFDPFVWPRTAPVLSPGPATSVDLNRPSGVAVDAAGNLYIVDTGYEQILKVTAGGTLSVVAGTGSYGAPTPGAATSSALSFPSGIAVDSSGNLYIAESGANKVLKVTTGGTLSVFAGTGTSGLPTPGPATSSNLGTLNGIAVDSTGNVFITDSTNNLIDKIAPDGTLSVVAGTGYRASPTPGPIADSDLGSTTRVATDSSGNIYILDSSYYLLEKVTFAPTVVAPDAPTSLSATPSNGSASISFTAGGDGGATVTKYQYQLGSGSWTDAVGTSSPITISGLTNGTTYSVKLRALNSVGSGAASDAVNVTPRTTPSAPTALVVTAGDGHVSLAFTPGANGGSAITKYQYRIGAGAWTDAVGSSPITITGVTNYTNPQVRLRAVNAAGAGTPSDVVTARTRLTGPTLSSATAASLTSVTVGYSGISILGATLNGYTATAYLKGTNTAVNSCRTTAAGRSCVISGLTRNTEYDIRVINYFRFSASPSMPRETLWSNTRTVTTNS